MKATLTRFICILALAVFALAGLPPKAQAADKVIMHLDFLINGYHAPFYIAQKKGWYKDAGIDATIRPGRGTSDSIKNVGSGNAQFGFPSFGAAAAAVAEGIPLMAVAAYLQEVPGGIISFESNPVRQPSDLEGKSIAVAPFGATAILLPAFLKKNNVDTSKVNSVKSNFGAIVPSFLTGKVDTSIGYYFGEYLAARDKMAGSGKKVLFMRVSDFGVSAYGNGLVVNADFMKSNPEATKRFIAGAVCPKCAEMDKLVMYKNEDGRDVRECVVCDYRDVMKSEDEMVADAKAAELQTRVTPEGKAIRDEGEQAIKIFDAMPPTKH